MNRIAFGMFCMLSGVSVDLVHAQVPTADSQQATQKQQDASNSGEIDKTSTKTVTLKNGLVCTVARRGGSPQKDFKGNIPKTAENGNSFPALAEVPTFSQQNHPVSVGMNASNSVLGGVAAILSTMPGQQYLNQEALSSSSGSAGVDTLWQDAWDRNTAARTQTAIVWNQAITSAVSMVDLLRSGEQDKLLAISEAIKLISYVSAASDPFTKSASVANAQQEELRDDGMLLPDPALQSSPAEISRRLFELQNAPALPTAN